MITIRIVRASFYDALQVAGLQVNWLTRVFMGLNIFKGSVSPYGCKNLPLASFILERASSLKELLKNG